MAISDLQSLWSLNITAHHFHLVHASLLLILLLTVCCNLHADKEIKPPSGRGDFQDFSCKYKRILVGGWDITLGFNTAAKERGVSWQWRGGAGRKCNEKGERAGEPDVIT